VDVSLYTRVLWRFKFVVLLGFIAAAALAFLSYASVSLHGSSPKIHYRQQETWQAQSTLFITQGGFPFGRSVLPVDIPPSSTGNKTLSVVPQYADPSRFYALAMLYARLAQSDAVMQILRRSGPVTGKVVASPIYTSDASNATTLPMIQISGIAAAPQVAQALAARATNAFLTYLSDEQSAAGIPSKQRVVVQEINKPLQPQLLAGRKKTLPILIFVAIMTIAVGLAFILENMRPRVREIAPATRQESPTEVRRTA
jgi:hypothetical protein